ncbi:hypothetical protein BDP81DRAFT_68323 [Colletotrichum phormii]|uniref:Uncharacterized protein n=1 Tax=Colletotrichum phormii TaxID=359342 RepID=A0AAJ0EC27_9PEZI|nr:uncharacterized protein BDP81DRAFT_68323 [Colletotrichum phormii]KAK1633579.1 hypothetical protein BDP81DRAFT_68323 [Colletotrichum phormii]
MVAWVFAVVDFAATLYGFGCLALPCLALPCLVLLLLFSPLNLDWVLLPFFPLSSCPSLSSFPAFCYWVGKVSYIQATEFPPLSLSLPGQGQGPLAYYGVPIYSPSEEQTRAPIVGSGPLSIFLLSTVGGIVQSVPAEPRFGSTFAHFAMGSVYARDLCLCVCVCVCVRVPVVY